MKKWIFLLLLVCSLIGFTAGFSYTRVIEQPAPVPVITVKEPEPLSVVRVKPIVLTKEERIMLARNVYFEAGVEDYRGKIAVATVTYNRWISEQWGKRLHSVIFAKGQFSWTTSKKKKYLVPTGEVWEKCLEAVRDFENGVRLYGMTDKVMYYHASYVYPTWAPKVIRFAKIGTHIFYFKS